MHDHTLYIVRHGCTKMNGEGGTSVDRIRAWTDVPLTDKGREEAREAAAKLGGKGIGAIVASNLSRARETAEIIGRTLGLTPTFTHKLRPWDLGKFTGAKTHEALPQIARYVREKPDTPVPDGESFDQFKTRAFQGFYEAVAVHPGQIVAIVTHHRDERLMIAWDKAGQPNDHAIEIDVLLQKGDPPGGVIKLTTTLAALKGRLTHEEAGFGRAHGRDRCGACKAYRSPDDCAKVLPPMDADDWCRVGVSKRDGHAFDPDAGRLNKAMQFG
jgi:broad specificity phosphatase PhoE